MTGNGPKSPAFDAAEVPGQLQPFVAAIRGREDADQLLASMLRKMAARIDHRDARRLAVRLREHAPKDAFIWAATEPVIRAGVPAWHFDIIRDEQRNRVYDTALRNLVRPDMNVLEIGAGTGLLAMMAARAGARHVYTIEIEPVIAQAARRNIEANGLSDRITVIEKDAMVVEVGADLPCRCDLIVHEVVANDLLSEAVLPLIKHAKRALLTPNAVLAPQTIEAYGLLSGDDIFNRSRTAGHREGFTLSALDVLGARVSQKNGPIEVALPLSLATPLAAIDLAASNLDDPFCRTVALEVVNDGVARGMLQWIGFTFPDGTRYSNPPDTASNWALRLHAFGQPVPVKAGQKILVPVELRDEMLVIGQPLA